MQEPPRRASKFGPGVSAVEIWVCNNSSFYTQALRSPPTHLAVALPSFGMMTFPIALSARVSVTAAGPATSA